MTYAEFNAFCRALPATSYVVQWGDSHVWKVGGKAVLEDVFSTPYRQSLKQFLKAEKAAGGGSVGKICCRSCDRNG